MSLSQSKIQEIKKKFAPKVKISFNDVWRIRTMLTTSLYNAMNPLSFANQVYCKSAGPLTDKQLIKYFFEFGFEFFRFTGDTFDRKTECKYFVETKLKEFNGKNAKSLLMTPLSAGKNFAVATSSLPLTKEAQFVIVAIAEFIAISVFFFLNAKKEEINSKTSAIDLLRADDEFSFIFRRDLIMMN